MKKIQPYCSVLSIPELEAIRRGVTVKTNFDDKDYRVFIEGSEVFVASESIPKQRKIELRNAIRRQLQEQQQQNSIAL